MQQFAIKRERMTVDLLLFQVHGASGQAMLERTLEANPGLADLGVSLPLGTIVVVPDMPSSQSVPARPVVSLFS